MKSEFLRPRLDGERFREHTLPLKVARDLAAYEILLIELAKHLYIGDNPRRRRVPKGFDADFHLHLDQIVEGSTIPILVVVANVLPLGDGSNPYFERARGLIAQCVASPQGQLPSEFPRHLLTHFNQFGRSLRSDEQLDLGNGAVLTPLKRKELVLAASKVYEREIELSGTIGEADWEKSTFRLRLVDGNHVVVPMTQGFDSQAREYGGRNRFQVTVKGVATYDSWEKLQKIVSVDTLAVQPDYQLIAKFDNLAALDDGWFEGQGIAPDKGFLAAVAERFIGIYPEDLPLPFIIPTPEGNLLLEWDTQGSPSIDLELESMQAVFHAFQPSGEDVERDFTLVTDDDWAEFFAFLNQNLEHNPE